MRESQKEDWQLTGLDLNVMLTLSFDTRAQIEQNKRFLTNLIWNSHLSQVLESNVAVLLEEVRSLNDDYAEVQRLDRLIETLRDYGGPTICHEWPYPLIFKGTIDEAHVAQILNNELELAPTATKDLQQSASEMTSLRKPRSKLLRFHGTRTEAKKANGIIKSWLKSINNSLHQNLHLGKKAVSLKLKASLYSKLRNLKLNF